MEHVNIISQEPIMMMAPWALSVILIFGFCMIATLLSLLVYSSFTNKKVSNESICKISIAIGSIGICILVVLAIVANIFFQVPSGRYEYKATIDEEQMTVAEYNSFMRAYTHERCINGIYYFEDYAE